MYVWDDVLARHWTPEGATNPSEDDMHPLTIFLAMDRDRERREAADRYSLERQLRTGGGPRRSVVRHQVALALAAVSRSSAAAVRRLDACLADELAGRLASSR